MGESWVGMPNLRISRGGKDGAEKTDARQMRFLWKGDDEGRVGKTSDCLRGTQAGDSKG
ncbi:MAG: hypothetical protein Fur0021_00060 [Candidatus Promineifilaceae bacterium]